MIKLLIAIRDILFIAKEIVLRIGKERDKKAVEKAVEESNESGSQRPIEHELSGDSGNPTRYDYDRMFKRKKKDRSGGGLDD